MTQHLHAAGRIGLGAIFVLMGVNYFISFLPDVPASPRGTAFLEAILATGYLFPLIKVLEIVCGLALLSRRAVLPALLLIAPVSVNIGLYHAFLDPNGAWLGFLTLGLTIVLLWPFRAAIAALFPLKPRLGEAGGPVIASPASFVGSPRS